VLIISRDVGIVLTVTIVNLAVGPRTFKPSPLGKAATAIFIVVCVVVMWFNWLGYRSLWVDAAIWLSLVITVASSVDYVWRFARIIR
jgi:phosphatidylglycerophosphate synthase